MVLNWSPEVFVNLTVSIVLFSSLIPITYTIYSKRIRSLIKFGISWFFVALFFLMEALSVLFLDLWLARIFSIIFFPATVFLVLAVDQAMSERINPIKLGITCFLGGISSLYLFYASTVRIEEEYGYPTINFTGLIENLIFISGLFWFVILAMHFSIKTFINAPEDLKKDAKRFLFSTILLGPVSMIIYSFIFDGFRYEWAKFHISWISSNKR